MSLSTLVVALLFGAQVHCLDLPKNFGAYRNFAGVAISEDFRKYVYLDKKGNAVEGKLPTKGRLLTPDTLIYHKWYRKNGNVEDHQICLSSKKPENYWCGELLASLNIGPKGIISYSVRIFRTAGGVMHGKPQMELGCPKKKQE